MIRGRGGREYEFQEPEFVDMGDAFRVIFYRTNKENDIENIETDKEISKDELFSALLGREKKVVEVLLKDPENTQDEMAEIMGMSKSGIRYVMNKLKNRGILVRVGATKKGKWSIKSKTD